MLVPQSSFLLLALVSLAQAARLTYWLSPGCPSGVQGAIDEAMSMADQAQPKIAGMKDDAKADFSRLFKTTSTPTRYKVKGYLSTIAGLISTSQDSASVQIYCDNDRRWTDSIPELPGNRDREKYMRIYKDPATGAIREGLPGCLDPDGGEAWAWTYTNAKAKKSSMTICDSHLNQFSVLSYAELKISKLDNTKLNSFILSATLLHEFTHLEGIDLDDNAYGWEKCLNLDASRALRNADTIAFWGVSTLLRKNGYTISDDGVIHKS
ncbi:hypothetical protein BJX70DRAFT_385070 [Aspergillus crustosus]